MQIIRSSRECKWVSSCPNCGCVFVYKGDEVEAKSVNEAYGLGPAQNGKPALEETTVMMVGCPECHYGVRVPKMAMYRRAAEPSGDEEDWD